MRRINMYYMSEVESGKSASEVCKAFEIGKTQLYSILKRLWLESRPKTWLEFTGTGVTVHLDILSARMICARI